MSGGRIGYVDYELDNYHANTYLKILRSELAGRGFSVAGCLAANQKTGREWAKKNEVPYFSDPGELNAAVDYFMILAPSNPETHLELCRQIFPFGKPTYVDKTFAPDLATAKKIFALADKHATVIQTSSALRYTNVQTHLAEAGWENLRHLTAWGSGRSFGEYGIHPLELAISCLGSQATRLYRREDGGFQQLLIDFAGGRTATINFQANANTPFAASLTLASGTEYLPVDGSRIFVNLAAAVLDFFAAGKAGIDRAESLAIMRLLDLAKEPRSTKSFCKL